MLPREIFKAGVPKTVFPAPLEQFPVIDLFRLYIFFLHVLLLRRFSPFFCTLKRVHAGIFMLACALFNEQDKEQILLSTIA